MPIETDDKSHPLRVRGLKHQQVMLAKNGKKSHPLRVRGLKPDPDPDPHPDPGSHPLRVRGLKREGGKGNKALSIVAPFTGAWIETRIRQ